MGGNSLIDPAENIQGGISKTIRWTQLGCTTTLIDASPQVSINKYRK